MVIAILILIAGLGLFLVLQQPEKGIGTDRPEEAAREVLALRAALQELPNELSEAGLLAGWREVDVVAEVSGRVVAPPVEVGTELMAGERLALLDRSKLEIELRSREAGVRKGELALRIAEREVQRLEPLRDDGVVSESAWNQAGDAVARAQVELAAAAATRDATRQALADADVRAPFAGRVVRRHVELGEFVAAGEPVARLVDLSRLRLRIGVPPAMVVAVERGQEASIEIDAYAGERFTGRVHSVAAEADASGLFPLDLVIGVDGERRPLPGMVARAHLVSGQGELRLLLPPSAVARRDGRNVVFVVDDAVERAHLRVVSLGARNGRAVEVAAGIEAGELIAYQGHAGLEDGDAVRVLAEGPAPQLGFGHEAPAAKGVS
ncbi:MAG: efflux RND transporter periplasmic adaptor subunit [Thermoanaerobaculia bacterium]